METFLNGIIARFVTEKPKFLATGDVIDEICFFILSYLERRRSDPARD
jgi:hypothetical protein